MCRIPLYWYTNIPQTICIKWGSTISDAFVSSGVLEGRICPNVYIDDLSNMLNNAGIGCHIHNYCTATSPSGLRRFLNIYTTFGFENDIHNNLIKSLCIYMNFNKLARMLKKTSHNI